MSGDFVRLFWSEEDRCYVADIPELFPCAAFGDSEDQALELLGVLMDDWLDAAERWGMPLPEAAERRAREMLGE